MNCWVEKALFYHEEHEGREDQKNAFFVPFVFFVVRISVQPVKPMCGKASAFATVASARLWKC
jgi:hypothetical protein